MKTVRQQEMEAQLRAEIAQRGLRIEQHGKAVRVVGVGVDVMASRLTYITVRDLEPISTPAGGAA
ncbi:MAG: hypothetical protein J0H00_08000 [Burkholderiales bacterium]|nr:hypothetical protein [Burkholderiales bacterium]OJX08199.1 MAG: hypothetical protein BGO72_01540 [Burkholderiales bacterium 70-64]